MDEIPTKIVKNSEAEAHKAKTHRILGVIAIIIAVAYIIMPIDFDGSWAGFIDDFFIFMAGFCYCTSQFSKHANKATRHALNKLALIFVIAAIAWVAVLAFTPLLEMVA